MAKCIFCLEVDTTKFNTIEHIVPESIGGGDWAVLPSGLFCDKCQNIFGSRIERQALADYPFIQLRTLLYVPNKRGKEAWFDNGGYKVFGSPEPNLIGLEIQDEMFQERINSGQISMFYTIAQTKRPDMLLRTLLKIGLEALAGKDSDLVFKSQFDAARTYALTGKKQYPWWFVQYEDLELFKRYLAKETWVDDHCYMYIATEDTGLHYLYLRMFSYSFWVPLYANVILDKGYVPNEPYKRLITVL